MTALTLRIAVVSDVHANAVEDKETYALVQPPLRPRNEDPLADLLHFALSRGLKADHIICPGDLSNRSDEAGKTYGWARLHELAAVMGASSVIAAPGNHDLVTHASVADPAAALKSLEPSYPTGDAACDRAFWSDGFVVLDYETHRIVVLNSCAVFPPHPAENATDEEKSAYLKLLDRGSFPEEIQIKLESSLASMDERPVNILLVHHHPVEHEMHQLFKDTYGPMHRGTDLIRILDDQPQVGRWIVVHGHKHVPRLVSTGGTSANSPVVLGAASLAGKLWHPVVTVTRNQFHLIEFELEDVPGLAPLRGSIDSFMWGFGVGWSSSSRRNSGLPSRCGFGFVADHRTLAGHVARFLETHKREFATWEELAHAFPALLYQGPRDFELLENHMESLGLVVNRNNDDIPVEISRSQEMS